MDEPILQFFAFGHLPPHLFGLQKFPKRHRPLRVAGKGDDKLIREAAKGLRDGSDAAVRALLFK